MSTQEKKKPTHRLVAVHYTGKTNDEGYPIKRYAELGALWETPKGAGLSGRIDALNIQVLVLPIEEKPENADSTDTFAE